MDTKWTLFESVGISVHRSNASALNGVGSGRGTMGMKCKESEIEYEASRELIGRLQEFTRVIIGR